MNLRHVTSSVASVALAVSSASAQSNSDATAKLLARAKSFELNTVYAPPPGDALSHDASGLAKTMCSAVFITGLDLDFAAENVGWFTAPYASRTKIGKPVVDRTARTVSVSVPGGSARVAKYTGGQGCVTLPPSGTLSFTPTALRSALPDAPVVPYRPRRRPLRATRVALAAALHATARAVEPAPRRRPEVCA